MTCHQRSWSSCVCDKWNPHVDSPVRGNAEQGRYTNTHQVAPSAPNLLRGSVVPSADLKLLWVSFAWPADPRLTTKRLSPQWQLLTQWSPTRSLGQSSSALSAEKFLLIRNILRFFLEGWISAVLVAPYFICSKWTSCCNPCQKCSAFLIVEKELV